MGTPLRVAEDVLDLFAEYGQVGHYLGSSVPVMGLPNDNPCIEENCSEREG